MPQLISLSAYLFLLWFFGLNELFSPGSVFVPHDTFYPISDAIWTTAFGTFNSAFNYSNNLAALMVLTPDAIIVGGLKLICSNHASQIIHIILCLVIFHSLSYLSINKIFQSSKLSALLTLCYCFSPYSSILYSAGIIYQLSTVVALGFLPLLLFNLMRFRLENIRVLIPLTALLAFGLLFFYPALLLILLTVFILWRREGLVALLKVITSLRTPANLGSIVLLSLPFIFFVYLTIIIGNDKGAILAGGTSSGIKGGMFYPLMQISAWGLYDVWSPRAILSFHNYFFENPYRILSISLITILIYFLHKNKKYTPIAFLLFLAFFAKGSNPPFGELFTFIINYFPLGYMIRSPDSKFGAFIAAWFVVAIYFLSPRQKLVLTILAALFLISNLTGMFSNGAISSSKGDAKTSTFLQDPEAKVITEIIESHSNAVVISDIPGCSGEWYEGRFHTCHGLISTSTNRQFIPSENRQALLKNITMYEKFPTLALINKRQGDKNSIVELTKTQSNFQEIYNSENYALYFRDSHYTNCSRNLFFACVRDEDQFLISLPEGPFAYYYPEIPYNLTSKVISTKIEPSSNQDEKRAIFMCLYTLSYAWCFWVVLISRNKHRR